MAEKDLLKLLEEKHPAEFTREQTDEMLARLGKSKKLRAALSRKLQLEQGMAETFTRIEVPVAEIIAAAEGRKALIAKISNAVGIAVVVALLAFIVIKNAGECFCKTYYQKYKLNFNIFRFFNTYGERQSDDFVISKFIYLAQKNQDIEIYGDGSQTRTFCYISDNIEATTSEKLSDTYNNKILNIGDDRVCEIQDVAKLIINLTDSKSQIVYIDPLNEGDMKRRQPDISNMKKILEKDLITLEKGLEKIILNT